MNLETLDRAKLLSIAEAIRALTDNKKYNLLDHVYPDVGLYSRDKYPVSTEFFRRGKSHRIRAFIAANRSGKSFTGATELTYHATGKYPTWWEGKVFKKPINAWVVCESGQLWRDSLQQLLLGAPGDIGSGLISKEDIIDTRSMPGVPGAIGQIIIKHKSGGNSYIVVKTYEMGREQFQAAKINVVLFDEEPPEEIFSEALTRTMGAASDPGIVMLLFTPLKGLSNVILKFLPNGILPAGGIHPDNPQKWVCQLAWENVPHLTEEDKQMMLAEYHPNERDARAKGIPALGSGRIYPLLEDDVVVKPFAIPDYFPRAFGLDFGWNSTAALWGAQDPVTNILYLYAEYKQGKLADYQHVFSIKERGDWISGAADPSGGGRRDDGRMRIDYYRGLGLNLHPGYNSLVTGIGQVYTMLDSGSLKVFSNLEKFLSEFRVYRYDTKDSNKPARNQDDHLLDCLRYLISMFDVISVSKYDMETSDIDPYDKYKQDYEVDSLTGY